MNPEVKRGILYLCVHKKLLERTNNSNLYSKKELSRMLGETFHVPKNLRVCVIKEMEKKGLIKCQGKRKSEVLVCKIEFDLEKDANKFYEWVGLY